MDIAIWVAIIGGLFSILAVFYKNWNEERRVNIAVFAELQRLITVIEEHRTWWEGRVKNNDTAFPLIAFLTPIFDQHGKNLGHIDTKVVAKVVKFYGYLKFINSLQAERPSYTAAGKSKEFDQQYLDVLTRISRDYKAEFNEVFQRHGLP